jgi:hypothetical protein
MSSLPTYAEFASSAPAYFFKTSSTPQSPHRNLNKFGCYDPYMIDYVGATISDEEGSEMGISVPPSPSGGAAPPAIAFPAAAPRGTFHIALWRRLELLQLPEISPVECPTPTNAFSLFVGQVRFETTAAELRWIIRRVANVLPIKAEPRGIGCFIVYFKSAADCDAVRRLHKRILFDNSGVWFARTELEVEVLFEYATNTLPYVSRRCHLPRDCMTVEDIKAYRSSSAYSTASDVPNTFSAGEAPVMPPPYSQA